MSIRETLNIEEKRLIGEYAASLIEANDFVYIDSGTTTSIMIDFLKEKNAVYVTNGLMVAKKLISKGFKTFILGGEIKESTEAIVGVEAIKALKDITLQRFLELMEFLIIGDTQPQI